jgi:dephospho-CoA kinase
LVKDERGGVRLTPGALNAEMLAAAVVQNDADVRRLARLIRPVIGE